MLTHNEIRNQSRGVFRQFGDQWKKNAEHNAALPRRNANELRNVGLGKVAVLVAMGAGLEDQIEVLKKYRERFDLYACDKAFGTLLEHGIKADYVVLADANIPFRWIEPYIEQTEGVGLIATAYANPEWTAAWKGTRYFYVNVDSIHSEAIFGPIMGGEQRTVPASSNISNAIVCFLTGCIDSVEDNFANYERYLLVGYDYSWKHDGNYYAFNNPTPKRFYMSHLSLNDINGDHVRTSENLTFSAKWLWMYLSRFQFLPVVNCSGRGLLDIPKRNSLEAELKRVSVDPQARERIINTFKQARTAYEAFKKAEKDFANAKEALIYGYR